MSCTLCNLSIPECGLAYQLISPFLTFLLVLNFKVMCKLFLISNYITAFVLVVIVQLLVATASKLSGCGIQDIFQSIHYQFFLASYNATTCLMG